MARRGRMVLAFGPMKPVGLRDPQTGKRTVRCCAASAGQRDGHAVQPRRLPDAAEVGRAEARFRHDSRLGECGIRPLRRHAPQHVPAFAGLPECALRDDFAAAVLFRGADDGRRGLCGERGEWSALRLEALGAICVGWARSNCRASLPWAQWDAMSPRRTAIFSR